MPPFPIGTFIGVEVGVGMFLLLVLLTSVVVLVLVVVERRKGAHKQKRGTPLTDNLWCDNSVVVMQEMEMKKEGVIADVSYQDVDYDKGEDDPVEDGNTPPPIVPTSALRYGCTIKLMSLDDCKHCGQVNSLSIGSSLILGARESRDHKSHD